jgi:hypothetical protein
MARAGLILLYITAVLAVWLALPSQIAAPLLAVNAIVAVAIVAVVWGRIIK